MRLSARDACDAFVSRFGHAPQWLVRAPGRVNLIGEHTDYNGGFVLPLAIDRAIWIALQGRSDRRVELFSADYGESGGFALESLSKGEATWIEYLKGVAWAIQDSGRALQGWEGVMMGDVPRGAGLSSSAALEMATARAFAQVSGFDWQPGPMALLGQRAENQWIGVQCGIMDQMISACGQAGHALLLDCRSLESQAVPFPSGLAVVILDTGTRRGLVDSAYNQRRAQCEAAARFFGVQALRDVDLATLSQKGGGLDESTRRRAKHVISENQRTIQATEAMRRGDAETLGRLMDESHESLRDDYEVSSEALNTMVQCAREHSACYGARMTGAGFGGCAVAIVDAQEGREFAEAVAAQYDAQTGHPSAVYVCRATDGAGLVEVPS